MDLEFLLTLSFNVARCQPRALQLSQQMMFYGRARILVQVAIYRRLQIGRDGHLDQSEAYDIS